MERMKRIVSLLLCAVMVIGFLPVSVFAAESDDALTASLNEAKDYIHSITLNNASNDPATVVKNFGTHFTWDNEKRESKESYLYDWSYYNGVVFEGIEYLHEVTGEDEYKDYVMEYMSSLIASDGAWAKCTNNSSKECAGYNATHGADCYKTASLLLDAYEMSGDGRYLTMAETLYADLDSAAASYSLPNADNNYRHTWSSDSDPDLWLDGLYMILPFRAEYAKYTGDTAELNLIVDRLQWVSDNMYNSSKKLFYHAADSATSNSGTYWLRAIGWYAAAIVDVMDSMEGENLETMKKQLKKLVDGMKACQNTSNGMWLNNMAAFQSSSNPYETSGTALVCYAVMKAVNNGWLDESYADMAILAFKGICNEKLSDNNLKDICFKGAPGSGNSTFYDNEGKGLGPFIMFYAEMLEYVNKPEEPEETVPETSAPTEPTVPETSAPVETEPADAVSGEGNLPGGTRVWYELVNTLTSGKQYLIVSRNTAGNTISMVTFGGFDANYTNLTNTQIESRNLIDPTRTLFLGAMSAQEVTGTVNQILLVGENSEEGKKFGDAKENYWLSFDGGTTYGENYGNTNYDYAFMETYKAIGDFKAQYQERYGKTYAESGRSIYVLFMTDGTPTNYDGNYFNYNKDDTRPDMNATWIDENGKEVVYPHGTGSGKITQDNWYEYIAGGTYNRTDKTIPGNPLYWATQVDSLPGVAEIFSIGFDIDNGGFSVYTFTEAADCPLDKVLEKLVVDKTLDVYKADDASGLHEVYDKLATSLKQAATNARFIDQMGDDFDLQMANVTYKPQVSDTAITLTNTITVSNYDIYTADDGVAENLIGKRKGNATVLEKVTFNANGTEAYSDQLSGNILRDDVICAKNFWYNTTSEAKEIILANGTVYSLPAETFYWNIGTISNKEFVLSYPVYLEGSREGTAAAGSYDTNNYADLHYTNWLNNEAVKKTESPVLAWKSALVNFGFYLVDDFGNPVVNRATGQTGSFEDAIKVTPKIFYDMIELNSNENVIEIAVSDHLPYGYEIFDTMAAYKITVDSGNAQSRWEITCNPALTNMLDEQIRSTYVTDYSGNAYTNLDSADLENHETIDYTSTTVWFAVRYSLSTVSDVFAIQLENRSGVDLQYGQIEVIADGLEYSFAVTNLRADAAVMLLEQGCSPAPETNQFTAEARDLAWFSEPMSVDAEVLNITGAKGVVNVKNISDQPINGLIHVYYKYIADDCYFGGITFRVKVEGGLQPGEIRQVPSGHFDPESCEVVDVTIYEQ